jgi:mgtE-like transporter
MAEVVVARPRLPDRSRLTPSRMSRPQLPEPVLKTLRAMGLPAAEIGRYWSSESRSIQAASGALAVGLLATLMAGAVLIAGRRQLEAVPGLIILIPAAIGMRGSLFGALASRLGTGILTGEFEPDLRRRSFLGRQIEAVALLTVSTATLAGVLAWALARLLGRTTVALLDLVAVSLAAGLLASVFLLGATILIARQAQQRGWNMDDVGAPLITATGDLVTLPLLLLAAQLLRWEPAAMTLGAVGLALGIGTAALGWRHHHDAIRRICRESLIVLTIAVTLQVLAGIVLESREEALVATVPALLGLVPPFAATCGSLGGLLSSRLSSKLHIGLVEPRLIPGKLAGLDVSLVVLLALLAFTGTGAIGWVGAWLVGTNPPSVWSLVAVALVGGFFATIALSIVAYSAAAATFRFGFDPDNHGIPIVTAAMDFLGILCLVSAVALTGVG